VSENQSVSQSLSQAGERVHRGSSLTSCSSPFALGAKRKKTRSRRNENSRLIFRCNSANSTAVTLPSPPSSLFFFIIYRQNLLRTSCTFVQLHFPVAFGYRDFHAACVNTLPMNVSRIISAVIDSRRSNSSSDITVHST